MSTPNSPSGGPPLRALAMVLIALAIVFAGIGAMSLSSSDSSDADASTAQATSVASATVAPALSSTLPPVVGTPPSSSAAAPTTTTPPVTTTKPAAGVDKSVPVRVFNNSMVSGLAAKTANDLTADGWNIAETGNYGAGVIPKTTVYYGSSAAEKAAALAIAAELGVTAEPRFAGISDSPPGVIVIVTGN
ncbi:LytR family transcriptional regulator [Nocardia sp. SYP-A9097]|uniref:LytR C-terminal domain-containing protein n=1 Tax=Nocardia sp. SYP-A9097 TaxID=2663237 RepID=UPI0013273B51|nr:LytR C-terminal domain-containing protein [Nocardia sp. SYP-A9097]MRH91959.1 LytR family transcriptional regulator [Nocardia sp. SYP-A9097]